MEKLSIKEIVALIRDRMEKMYMTMCNDMMRNAGDKCTDFIKETNVLSLALIGCHEPIDIATEIVTSWFTTSRITRMATSLSTSVVAIIESNKERFRDFEIIDVGASYKFYVNTLPWDLDVFGQRRHQLTELEWQLKLKGNPQDYNAMSFLGQTIKSKKTETGRFVDFSGYHYPNRRIDFKPWGKHIKVSMYGKDFWYFISDRKDCYSELIDTCRKVWELLGVKVNKEKTALINRITNIISGADRMNNRHRSTDHPYIDTKTGSVDLVKMAGMSQCDSALYNLPEIAGKFPFAHQ